MFAHLPSLNGIRVFEAAARHLSFKLAAKELSLTPTAVSHQIRNLESLLKVALFTRHTRAVTLTEAGESLYATSHQLLRQLEQSIGELTAPVQLTLSAPSALASLWLIPALADFATQWPEIRIQVTQGDTLAVADTHFCISRPHAHSHSHADIHNQTLLTLPEVFGVYASPAYLQRRHDSQTLMQLSAGQTATPGIPDWDVWGQEYGSFREAKKVEFEREEELLQACLAGQGLALISSLLASGAVARGWLSPCLADKVIPGPGYTLLRGPKATNPKAAQPFIEWLGAHLSQ